MAKKLEKSKNSKSVVKSLAWSALGFVTAAELVGMGFGIANFIKTGSKNIGRGYDDVLQTQLQLQIPQTNADGTATTDDQNMQAADVISNKLSTIADILGVDDIQVQSGIQKAAVDISSNKTITYTNVYWYTSKKLLSYDFDIDVNKTDENNTKTSLQAKLDELKLTLYYRLAQNYRYLIQDASKWTHNGSNTTVQKNPNFEDEVYQLNNVNDTSGTKITRAYKDSSNNLMFDLRPNTTDNADNKTWDLSALQAQFTDVYKWDGSTTQTRDEVISSAGDDSSSVTLTKPNVSYIFYRNRSGLINLLQNLTTVAYINNMSSSLSATQLERAKALYDNVVQNNEYKTFMEWVVQSNYTWSDVMELLYHAQSEDFGVVNNNGRVSDPLLDFLNSYYTSTNYRDAHDNLTSVYKDYEFLYSWNFKNDKFINQYLVPIDYYNWFNYFVQDATKSQLNDAEYVKSTYVSKKINTNWLIYDYSLGSINSQINALNTASFDNPFVNYYLTPIVNQGTGGNASQLYTAYFDNFLGNFVTTLPNTTGKSITKINPFVGVMIGLSTIILLIGIIVAIIYRIPGVLFAFSAASSFCLGLLMMANLGITFTIASGAAIVAGIICMVIPFIYAMKEFRYAFREKYLNLANSFKKAISALIKSSVIINVNLLIIALVFMFFGSYQVHNFGATLTLIFISNFTCTFVALLVMFSLMYFLAFKNHPNLMFGKNDLLAISKTKRNIIGHFEDNSDTEIKTNRIDNWSAKIANNLISYNWKTYIGLAIIAVICIVGTILLVTQTSRGILFYNYFNQITLTFLTTNTQSAYDIADKLAQQLNLNWLNVQYYENIYNGVYSQLVLTPTTTINAIQLYNAINSIDSTWTTSIQLLNVSPYFSGTLLNNFVSCIFISIGFLLLFNLFMLNIIAVIPIFILSLLGIFIGVGVIGITTIMVNFNTLFAFGSLFIVLEMLIITNFMGLKLHYDMNKRLTPKEIMVYAIKETKRYLTLSFAIVAFFWLAIIIMVLFDSSDNLANYLIMWLSTLVGFFGIVILTPLCFAPFMIVRELYLSKVVVNKNTKTKHKSYDKVDEQLISGINHS